MISNSDSSYSKVESSPYTPVVINVENGEVVHQRILLIYGRAGPQDMNFESKITVEHHVNNFPSTTWQVFNSHFKCLVHLDAGLNNIKFILDTSPFSSDSRPLTTIFQVNYVPLLQNPPLNLAILVAKDSKEIIDAPEEKENSGENKLESVKAKLRCAGYLWQAFTAEQMSRNGFGRRVFRLDEEWTEDTISNQNPGLRQTAKIHIIRSSYTLKQILDPDIAQQNPNGVDDKKKDLYSIFMDSLKEYGAPFDKQCYVAGLILDSHYDTSPNMGFIRGHAALGGGWDNIRLGIFGSHLTHAWPRYLEEVVSCFQDNTITDENRLSNDAGESGTWWRCCNIGIGAFLHEVGHCLTAPHSPSGIMSRGFNNLNRTFTVKEPNNPFPTTPSEEEGAHWYRSNVIRFRYHPCFRLPFEPPAKIDLKNIGADFWILNKFLLIKCSAGISLIEIYVRNNIIGYLDYSDEYNQTEIRLKVDEIIKKYGGKYNIIKMNFVAKNQTETFLQNLQKFSEESKIILPIYGKVFKSNYLGKLDESLTEFKILFKKFIDTKPITLKRMIIKYDVFINSITFYWSDNTNLRIGIDDDEGIKKEFLFEEGEKIVKIKVNSGWYIDGFEIKTNLGRRSKWFGGHGGSKHTLEAPDNEYEMIGLYGTGNYFVNTLGIIYKKIS
ncbi:uncharacterized protein OCT59_012571 [Rhizophagus irregularis]|uniref:Zinc metalloproteinase n=3 Tax=Rhizophagus irregularis TaxID=588596 RepID=A0A2H5QYG8_RHIID|nr:putative zinc metalloproteinase [Rhizophagus irregularis DAOM 181602=DAOM 197198]EXX67586.1 putative metalloendopeptidase [Rhizophagus irregularis DAOM 197198w]UZO01473.1 hypothetical protein OCT59_012571 [Rhizophagus irregularis]POG62723.1 putative zinc metalloproteinase [Rhizophagus irregularis DAOM 181602=DAOM 197198]CAG8611278.1 7779_t:CDS:2 [Rhizophagus irregularis]GBC10890.1 putative zinc metalloproteinase [Rhizophagus irregularis DAOM 181602=DAOM 197198]|eukprot:XP_025169589.1 putative zinc metalloproteinase [Rhizophagus irregularis DAOM 181602=DAOM 197198]